MDTTQKGKEVLLEKLRAMQFAETAKPSDRMDVNLVDVLTDMLLDLDDISPCKQTVRDSGIKTILEVIGQQPANTRRKRLVCKILIASIIAALIFAAGLVYITLGSQGNSDQFRWAHYIVEHLLPGRSIDTENGITIYNDGISRKYSNIEAFLNDEGLNILYPTILPEKHSVTGIQLYNHPRTNKTRITFLSNKVNDFSISVNLNCTIPKEIQSNRKPEYMSGYQCFITTEEKWCQCVFQFKGDLYTIDCQSLDSAILIISNMKGITQL